MPDEITVTDADRAVAEAAWVIAVNILDSIGHLVTPIRIDFAENDGSIMRDAVASVFCAAMRPERERTARMEAALKRIRDIWPWDHQPPRLTQPMYDAILEARAALGEVRNADPS